MSFKKTEGLDFPEDMFEYTASTRRIYFQQQGETFCEFIVINIKAKSRSWLLYGPQMYSPTRLGQKPNDWGQN